MSTKRHHHACVYHIKAHLGPQPLAVGGSVPLPGRSIQSEIRASFAVPTQAARVGVSILTGSTPNGNPISTDIYIDFTPAPNSDSVGGGGGGADDAAWEVNIGYDTSSMSCPQPKQQQPQQGGRYEGVPHKGNPMKPPPNPANRTACPKLSAPMLMKASDATLEIAIWVDNVFAEVYFNAGRAVWTVPLPCEAIVNGGGASVFVAAIADGAKRVEVPKSWAVQLLNATAWDLNAITYDDVGPDITRT